MTDRLTSAEGMAGIAFLTIQLLLSLAVVWYNNTQFVLVFGFSDYVMASAVALLLGILAVFVVGYAGDNLLVKIPVMIGVWFVVAAVGFWLNLFTSGFVLAETALVTLTSLIVMLGHRLLA